MTDEELKALVAENSLAIRESRQQADRLWQEMRASRQESEKRWQESRQEILVSRQETDRLISSFNLQLGRLGNKLGDYTESLFRPSLERAFREQFGMTTIFSPLHLERDGEELERIGVEGAFCSNDLRLPDEVVLRIQGVAKLNGHWRISDSLR